MKRTVKSMTDREVLALSKRVGTHSVGGVKGLVLRVRQNNDGTMSALWMIRIQSDGKDRKKSLGAYPAVSLAQARQLATKFVAGLSSGRDMFAEAKEEKEEKKRLLKQKAVSVITFGSTLNEFLDYKQERDWKRGEADRIKEERRIRNHLGSLMSLPVAKITPEDIADALRPIWCEKSQTADRLQYHLHGYFRWAMVVKKCRERGYNPAEKTFLKDLLPPKSKRKAERPQPALSVEQLPLFMKALHERSKTHFSALCLELAILTCVRSANVRELRWEQLNADWSVWEIDAEDMKVSRNGQHRIPLSCQAIEVIKTAQSRSYDDLYVFPSERKLGQPLSNSTLNSVIRQLHEIEEKAGREGWIDREQSKREGKPILAVQHGICRATFKTWAESTRQDSRAVELILHHDIDPRLKSAYDRSPDMKQKADVLQNWADFCYSMVED